jgi:Flp pilus assembly pilin Flp
MRFDPKSGRYKKGGTMAEYAAMAFLIIIVVVGVFMLLGISIGDLIRPVADIF